MTAIDATRLRAHALRDQAWAGWANFLEDIKRIGNDGPTMPADFNLVRGLFRQVEAEICFRMAERESLEAGETT